MMIELYDSHLIFVRLIVAILLLPFAVYFYGLVSHRAYALFPCAFLPVVSPVIFQCMIPAKYCWSFFQGLYEDTGQLVVVACLLAGSGQALTMVPIYR